MPIGAVILVHGTIIGERQLGVTEWLLSKPVSRRACVLSKLLANGLGALVSLTGLQVALGYGLLALQMGKPLPPLQVWLPMGITAILSILFVKNVISSSERGRASRPLSVPPATAPMAPDQGIRTTSGR